MSIYGTNYISHRGGEVKNINLSEMTDEEIKEYYIVTLENIVSLFDEDFTEDIEHNMALSEATIISEGANIELTKAMKTFKSSYKLHMKSAKKLIKVKEYDKAIKELQAAKTASKKMGDTINNTRSNVGSAVFGYFASLLVDMAKFMIPIGIAFTGGAITRDAVSKAISTGKASGLTKAAAFTGVFMTGIGGAVSWIMSIVEFVKTMIYFIDTVKDPKASTADALNFYRKNIVNYYNDLNSKIDGLIELCKQKKAGK